jgi:hypothetical protein
MQCDYLSSPWSLMFKAIVMKWNKQTHHRILSWTLALETADDMTWIKLTFLSIFHAMLHCDWTDEVLRCDHTDKAFVQTTSALQCNQPDIIRSMMPVATVWSIKSVSHFLKEAIFNKVTCKICKNKVIAHKYKLSCLYLIYLITLYR